MAMAKYFLLFTIIFQITNLSFCDTITNVDDAVTETGIGSSRQLTRNYQNNVNSLLPIFISESSRGFFNTSVGNSSDTAYGSYLCRGDLTTEECSRCLNGIRRYVSNPSLMAYLPDGILYNVDVRCIVHYANSPNPFVYTQNSGVAITTALGNSSPQYSTALSTAVQGTISAIGTNGNSSRPNFATRVVDVPGSDAKINVLVQCTPDISAMNCTDCLNRIYGLVRPNAIIGRAFASHCLLKAGNETLVNSGIGAFMPNFSGILFLLFTLYLTLM